MSDALWTGSQVVQSNLLGEYLGGAVLLLAGGLVHIFDVMAALSSNTDSVAMNTLLTGILVFLGVLMLGRAVVNQRGKAYRIDADGVTESFTFLVRRENRIKFDRITNVTVSQGVLDRYFGTGSVRVHTAGEGNTNRPEIELQYLPDYDTAADLIEEHA